MTTKTATKVEPALDEHHPDFMVVTHPLKVREQDGDGAGTDESMRLVATASSTAVDLEADRFTRSALEQMRDGFKGRLIFMNHSYRVPADVFGVVEETSLVKRDGRFDLDMTIRVEKGNPLAVQTYEYVANGTRLGVSVGVIVTEADKTEEEDEYGKRIVDISGVIPLEASIVGIPANQTAWTQQAVKSLWGRGAIEFDEQDLAARPWLTKPSVVEKETAMDTTDETAVTAALTLEDELGLFKRGAVPGHSPAKAPRDRPWQVSAAVKRLRTWAGGPAKDDINWSKYRWGFAWFNGENPENFGSYKLAHHDIVDGTFMVVFRGAVAAAVVLQGGRGGVALPEGDVDRVKSHVARHYHQFDEKAPWEREKSADWLPDEVEVAADLEVELPDFAEAFWPNTWNIDSAEQDDADEDDEEAERDSKDTLGFLDEEVEQEERSFEVYAKRQQGDVVRDLATVELEGGDAEEGDAEEKENEDSKEDDFEDEVNADLAVDTLIDTMFSGFRVCVNSLIDILLNTDLDEEERREQGASLIEEYQEFVSKTWNETIDSLSGEKALGENFNVDVILHEILADSVECDADRLDEIEAEVEQIRDVAQGFAEENARLNVELARKVQALEYASQVIDAIMELPLPVVTSKAREVAQTLASRYPTLDTRVVDRLVQYAPQAPDSKKE